MALTYDATKVADFDNLTDNEKSTYDALIWATMGVGMNEITDANAREFFARVSFLEKIQGTYSNRVTDDGLIPHPLTADDVRRFVGLRTNASRLSIVQFRTQVWKSHERWNVTF